MKNKNSKNTKKLLSLSKTSGQKPLKVHQKAMSTSAQRLSAPYFISPHKAETLIKRNKKYFKRAKRSSLNNSLLLDHLKIHLLHGLELSERIRHLTDALMSQGIAGTPSSKGSQKTNK